VAIQSKMGSKEDDNVNAQTTARAITEVAPTAPPAEAPPQRGW
jgi:hypothetical protein